MKAIVNRGCNVTLTAAVLSLLLLINMGQACNNNICFYCQCLWLAGNSCVHFGPCGGNFQPAFIGDTPDASIGGLVATTNKAPYREDTPWALCSHGCTGSDGGDVEGMGCDPVGTKDDDLDCNKCGTGSPAGWPTE